MAEAASSVAENMSLLQSSGEILDADVPAAALSALAEDSEMPAGYVCFIQWLENIS